MAKVKAEETTDAAKGSATYTKSTTVPASQNVANMSTMIESSPILLKTVVNAVTSGYTEADANILFDDTSQRTLITIIFAEILGMSIIRYDYLRLYRLELRILLHKHILSRAAGCHRTRWEPC